MRVSEKRALRKSIATKGRMKQETRENSTVRSFVICIILQTLFEYEAGFVAHMEEKTSAY
jgi:hypothetical protein